MITKNYIKMCEKAEEIQKEWKPKIGDKFANIDHAIGMIILFPVTKEEKQNFIKDKFWLPTQEQLQEMILKIFSPFAKIIKLDEFVSNYVKIYKGTKYEKKYWVELYPTAIESINEFWLMYVMYEKYHKIWTGEKWVKI